MQHCMKHTALPGLPPPRTGRAAPLYPMHMPEGEGGVGEKMGEVSMKAAKVRSETESPEVEGKAT